MMPLKLGMFVILIVFATLGGCIGWLIYAINDTQPPYMYDAAKSYIIPSPASPGHQVQVHWSIKINRICPGTLIRNIVDANTMARTTYDPVLVNTSMIAADDHLDRAFLLPEGMHPGPKLYRVDAEYVCNPLQKIWPLKISTPELYFVVK